MDYKAAFGSDDDEMSINDIQEKYLPHHDPLFRFSFEGHQDEFDDILLPPDTDAPEQTPAQPEDHLPKHIDTQNSMTFSGILGNIFFQIDPLHSISVLVQPDPHQHVRYEKESKKTLRYNKASDGKPIKINLPRELSYLWELCKQIAFQPWIQITRTTAECSGIFGCHPYPIWMKNSEIVKLNGSLYKRITENDINNGYIEIDNLVLIILKQDQLEQIDTLVVYNESTMMFSENYFIDKTSGKQKIKLYDLRRSALHFQIILTDATNVLYPTDCCCKTVEMTEFTGSRPSSSPKRKRCETRIRQPSNKSGHT